MPHEIVVSGAVFLCLIAASLGALLLSDRLPAHYRNDDTHNVVRHAANIFVVTTSLVLGLLLNSSKNTFEAVDRNMHAFATDLVLLDRALRRLGPEAADVRQKLAAYLRQAIHRTWGADGSRVLDDRVAERLLDQVGDALIALQPSDPLRAESWRDAHVNFQNVVKRRWGLIEESEGTIPAALVFMVSAWLVLIFGSFGYRAPRNTVVAATLVVAAFLIAGSIYLILDMDRPFLGAIQVTAAPLQRAEAQLLR